jgi:hypothetical protein
MKAEKKHTPKPARLTPEVLKTLQQALMDNIKPEYKERKKDDDKTPQKRHRNKKSTRKEK